MCNCLWRDYDVVDQTSELTPASGFDQIALPSIVGNVRFENISFRFGTSRPYQFDDVSIDVKAGNFVGIVGQSGSGKSTS